jgi:hypothetical protein
MDGPRIGIKAQNIGNGMTVTAMRRIEKTFPAYGANIRKAVAMLRNGSTPRDVKEKYGIYVMRDAIDYLSQIKRK